MQISEWLLTFMTEKQERILNAALHLFAEEGYRVTPTSKVAKQAGVSEGLIFRHYENKEGLLNAIIKMSEERFKELFANVLQESEPSRVIKQTLEIYDMKNLTEEDVNFWKLIFKIKWEMGKDDDEQLKPLEQALTNAFEKLGYSKPIKEAQLLMVTLEGLTTTTFLNQAFDNKGMIELLKEKYDV